MPLTPTTAKRPFDSKVQRIKEFSVRLVPPDPEAIKRPQMIRKNAEGPVPQRERRSNRPRDHPLPKKVH